MKYLIIFLLLLIAELIYFRVADHFSIIDKPNARSSHNKVVLRGGGIIYLFGVCLYSVFFGLEHWPFLIGLTIVAGVSFTDDIHSLSDSVRLAAQTVAMFLMLYDLGVLNWQSWWIILLSLILCVGIINAYNFMDGINGMNGGYSLAVLIPLAWMNHSLQFTDQNLIYVTIIADLVFCIFNFRPKGNARCFAGDVGSVGVAFIVIYLLGGLVLTTGDFTYIVFLVVYGVDSVLTIVHRILLHENLGEAHRKHAYQLLTNELKIEHTVVSSIYMVLQLIIAAGLIWIPNSLIWHWGYFIVVCILLGAVYVLFMRRYYHLHEEYLKSSNV